jgi:superfamily II DNA helicase RecQ
MTARRTLDQIEREYSHAKAALEEAHNHKLSGRPVYRSTPACSRECNKCDIACAVITATFQELEQELISAGGAPGAPALSHMGRTYFGEAGRC